MLPESPSEPEPEIFHVHPVNWQAFEIFESCATQWRCAVGMSGLIYQGLDYPSLMAVMDMSGVKKRSKVFNQVRLIEAGALSVINEQQDIPDNATDSR